MKTCFDCGNSFSTDFMRLIPVWDQSIEAEIEHYVCKACIRRRELLKVRVVARPVEPMVEGKIVDAISGVRPSTFTRGYIKDKNDE